MPVVPPICGGIDVHQAQLTACVRRVDADGQVTPAVRACATTDDALCTFSWRGRAMRRRGTIACRTDRRNASRSAQSKPWSGSATASPWNAPLSGQVLQISAPPRHSPRSRERHPRVSRDWCVLMA